MANQIHEELEKWLTISNFFFSLCMLLYSTGGVYMYTAISACIHSLCTYLMRPRPSAKTLAARNTVAHLRLLVCLCTCSNNLWYNCSYQEPIWACTTALCLRFCLTALERLGKNTEEDLTVIQCHCDVVGCNIGGSLCLCGS